MLLPKAIVFPLTNIKVTIFLLKSYYLIVLRHSGLYYSVSCLELPQYKQAICFTPLSAVRSKAYEQDEQAEKPLLLFIYSKFHSFIHSFFFLYFLFFKRWSLLWASLRIEKHYDRIWQSGKRSKGDTMHLQIEGIFMDPILG